ncbi:MAG: PEP-CTERM sorting domain-containing protein [Planctomycetota bacterium]|jgi:hypothetical protein
MKKFLILMLVLGMTSTAGATLTLVPESLTIDNVGLTGTIQVVSDVDGDYSLWIELVDLTVADYDGDPTFTPGGDPIGISQMNKYDAHWYGEVVVASTDPGNPIVAGAHININLIGVSEGTTTVNIYDVSTLLDSSTITVLPEPMTIALLGLGGLFLLRRRK